MMEHLADEGHFSPPSARSLETVLQRGLAMKRGRVFVDLWDVEKFFHCDACRSERLARLDAANKSQRWIDRNPCPECGQ